MSARASTFSPRACSGDTYGQSLTQGVILCRERWSGQDQATGEQKES